MATLVINSTTTHVEFTDTTANFKVSGSYDKSEKDGLIRVMCSYVKVGDNGVSLTNVGNASYTRNPDGKQYNKNIGCVENDRVEIEEHFNALLTTLTTE